MTDSITRRRLLATAVAALPLAAMPRLALAQAPDFLTIGGGPSGGVFGIVGTGMADILSRVFPSTIIDVQPGGSGPNLLRVRDGKADLGITSANNALDAWEGRDPATPDSPVQNARGLMNIMQSAIQIWVDGDSDIRTLDDLRGKQVSAGQPGQTSWLAFENLLAAAGMTTDDIEADGGKLHPLSWSESHEALRNGQLDAVMWLSLWPHPTVMQNETVRPMRALSFDDAVLDKFMEDSGAGFEKVSLPAGLFGGQDIPANTVGTNTILFAAAEMPDDFAYAVVKQLWENLDDFKAVHSLLGNISEETVGRGMIIPLHPGAVTFYEEMGIPVSDSKLGA
ncbi:NMT1-like family protein [Antarctobacter heliothermus]|uniref:NMT1-like family protein n=1 Tax=Antarctobacter heliothermus TaxID=74033 RepID=A0A222E1L4_9RHOB|nr:TAXI family TRAP transporter solute-binding subunit [Antarctobacter heliothermus]ASP20070.1 NMT1-like family protein [Antarctobacter heliothermus]